jgi:hypothetical protein
LRKFGPFLERTWICRRVNKNVTPERMKTIKNWRMTTSWILLGVPTTTPYITMVTEYGLIRHRMGPRMVKVKHKVRWSYKRIDFQACGRHFRKKKAGSQTNNIYSFL